MANDKHRQVLVIGAGPVGLVAALALKHYGLNTTILEAEHEGRQRPGSRAIYIHKATLEFLEEICPGLGFKMAEYGIVWPMKRTFFHGKEVYRKEYDLYKFDPNKLPPFTSLPQDVFERIAYAACQEAGVEFFWSTPVKEVKTSDTGVEVHIANGDVWTCEYLVAADGSRSTVRKTVGIEMEGTRSRNAFIVVDVAEDEMDPLPLERVFHYYHPNMGDRHVLLVPFRGGWRIDLQLYEDDDLDEYGTEEGVRQWLPKVMPAKYADRITWVSTYQFLQVVAKSYTDEHCRIFLTGEAAHLFAPFGARGLNSGVPDAIAAVKAFKEALEAPNREKAKEIVRHYADQRLQAGRWNRDAAGIALNHVLGKSEEWQKFAKWLDDAPYGPKSGPVEIVGTKY
jgi:3-(3-hydroxy-phenyl)propionate hydroxylase